MNGIFRFTLRSLRATPTRSVRQLCGHNCAAEVVAYSNGVNVNSSPGEPRQSVRWAGHEARRSAPVASNTLRRQRPKRTPPARDRRGLPQRNDGAITKSLTERVVTTWSALEQ